MKITGYTTPSWPHLALILLTLAPGVPVKGAVYRVPLHTSDYLTSKEVVEMGFDTQEKDLQGRPGQGYYIQMKVGQPPQEVSDCEIVILFSN